MGGCVSPTMANAFLCHHETQWLKNCPIEFKPVLYRRYVDDCFLLFKEKSHIMQFHEYLNKKHERIQFTYEIENNNCLPFLDVLVTRENRLFKTSTYRKPTHTGLGMKFSSAISNKFKFNLVDCMIDRAYKISSTVYGLTQEISKLKKFFSQNGFNQFSLNRRIFGKLEKIKNPDPVTQTVSKKTIYASLPYMSEEYSNTMMTGISRLVTEFFPHVDIKIAFRNRFTTSSLFKFKDEVPLCVRSNLVYQFNCGMCNSKYIGETSRHYTTRVAEHMGVSPRTGAPMARVQSNVYSHFLQTGHQVSKEDFKVLYSRATLDLKASESIAIHQFSPDLNDKQLSVPLNIL